MTSFLELSLAWPTALWSMLLVVVLLYWAFVIFGAVDVEILEFDGALDGAAEGIDGALDGAAEGLDGALDGAADGIDGALDGADGAADGIGDAAEGAAGGLVGLLSTLGLRAAPLTVVLSFLVFFSWVLSHAGNYYLGELLSPALRVSIVGVGAFLLAVPLTAATVRPLGPMFKTELARNRRDLIGSTCTVTTGRVDARFGQADCQVGTDHLLIQARYRGTAPLARGHEALIVDYDRAEEAYIVEPLAQAPA